MDRQEEIIAKLDEILEYLKSRKPEVDEKLHKMLACACNVPQEEADKLVSE